MHMFYLIKKEEILKSQFCYFLSIPYIKSYIIIVIRTVEYRRKFLCWKMFHAILIYFNFLQIEYVKNRESILHLKI